MPKFHVKVRYVHFVTLEVEAESAEHAEELPGDTVEVGEGVCCDEQVLEVVPAPA